jgi:nucleolar protein TMA23
LTTEPVPHSFTSTLAMDAAALLRSQGWRGKGFSLHPTDNAIGLAKPLLLSRNTDGRGIGQKAHYTSDQWWLHAFDQKLKGLDTTSHKGAVVQSVTQGKLDVIASGQPNGRYTGASGLYASFVRGGMLEGTMEIEIETQTVGAGSDSTDATPASSDDSDGPVSKKEKHGETKAERRARRAARRLREAEKAARKAAEAEAARRTAEKAARKEAKRLRKASETKEEKRARKAERRARKEAKRRKRERAVLQKPDQG